MKKRKQHRKLGPMSEEHKRKISEANSGRVKSKAYRKKISRTLTGRKLSKTHRANISKGRKEYFAKRRSEREALKDAAFIQHIREEYSSLDYQALISKIVDDPETYYIIEDDSNSNN